MIKLITFFAGLPNNYWTVCGIILISILAFFIIYFFRYTAKRVTGEKTEFQRNHTIIIAAFFSLFILYVYGYCKYEGLLTSLIIPESLISIIIAAPVAWVLWIWRNHDKTQNIELLTTKEDFDRFIQLTKIAEDEKEKEGIRSAAIIALLPYLKGEMGTRLHGMSISFLRALLNQLCIINGPSPAGQTELKIEYKECFRAAEYIVIEGLKAKWLAPLDGFNFSGMNFNSISLPLKFSKCFFKETEFSNVIAQRAEFKLCTFDKAQFIGGNFSNSQFTAFFRLATFGGGVNFSNCRFMLPSSFQNAAFPCCNFSNSFFDKTTSFKKCNFTNVDFSSCKFESQCNFSEANFFYRGIFDDNVFGVGCIFDEASLCLEEKDCRSRYPFFCRSKFYNPQGESFNDQTEDFAIEIDPKSNIEVFYVFDVDDESLYNEHYNEEVEEKSKSFAKIVGTTARQLQHLPSTDPGNEGADHKSSTTPLSNRLKTMLKAIFKGYVIALSFNYWS